MYDRDKNVPSFVGFVIFSHLPGPQFAMRASNSRRCVTQSSYFFFKKKPILIPGMMIYH